MNEPVQNYFLFNGGFTETRAGCVWTCRVETQQLCMRQFIGFIEKLCMVPVFKIRKKQAHEVIVKSV